MADLAALEVRMHRQIPLTRAMQARVVQCDAHGLVLSAPLTPNLNHKHTAFGGSLSTLATLSGWMLTEVLLEEAHIKAEVVIQHGETRFLRPVAHDFCAHCPRPAAQSLEHFFNSITRHGKGKLDLDSRIANTAGEAALHFSGRYVALRA